MLLRPAEPADALAVARVHIRSWQVAYRGIVPDAYLDQLCPEERASRYTFQDPDPLKPYTIVATERASILGFASTMPAREADLPDAGELGALYVDPDHWGRGIGVELIAAARSRLSTLGFRQGILWMLEGNVRAAKFYQTDGWTADGARMTKTWAGVDCPVVRYQRPKLT